LYTSHISEWRKQAAAGAREGLARKSRKRRSAEQIELDRLRRQNERLAAELKRTQTALEITGKVHALLEQLSESADTETGSKP
jgi:transposase-like protein